MRSQIISVALYGLQNMKDHHHLAEDLDRFEVEMLMVKDNPRKRVDTQRGASSDMGGVFRKPIKATPWRRFPLFALGYLSSSGQFFLVEGHEAVDETALSERSTTLLPKRFEEHQGSGRALGGADNPTLTTYRLGLPSVNNNAFGERVPSGCPWLDMSHFEKGRKCGLPLSLPCFDYKRCQQNSSTPALKVYVYDSDCTLSRSSDMPSLYAPEESVECALRHAARESELLAETYESACLFIHVRRKAWADCNLCATSAPLWNDGANHPMVDFTDQSRCGFFVS